MLRLPVCTLLLIAMLGCGSSLAAQQYTVDSLKRELISAKQDSNHVKLLNDIGFEYFMNGNYDSTLVYVTQGAEMAGKISYLPGLADAYNMMGAVHNYQGAFDEAVKYYTMSVELKKVLNDKKGMAKSYNNIGLAYFNKGDYEKAIEFYLESVRIKELIGDRKGAATTYNNIGNIYMNNKDHELALQYFGEAIDIRKEINDSAGMAMTYNNIGGVEQLMNNLEPAKEHLFLSLKIATAIADTGGMALAYNSLGSLFNQMNDQKTALLYYTEALAMREKSGDRYACAVIEQNMGSCYISLGDYVNAKLHLDRSLEITQEIDARTLTRDSYKVMAEMYHAMGDDTKAYDYFDRYFRLRDSLESVEKRKTIEQLRTIFETERKDKELLQKDAEISEQEAESARGEVVRNWFIFGFAIVFISALLALFAYTQKRKANAMLAEQKQVIEEKNKDITDSIHYARRIQKAMLTSDSFFRKNLPEHFILYKPKDIVSGDFYWAATVENENKETDLLVAVADCTGHGVPGAFMSMIGISFLNEIVIEKKVRRPDIVLNQLREMVIRSLNPENDVDEATIQDGMDIALLRFSKAGTSLEFAAANNPVWLFSSSGEMREYKADKFPVGKYHAQEQPFTLHTVALNKGDTVYAFTDGYADQFGGPQGKKFKYKQLAETLRAVQGNSLPEQKQVLDQTIIEWRGTLEQVDDVLMIGMRMG